MIETNRNHIPLIPPYLLRESSIVRDYCEIIQNSWWRNFAVFVVAPIHNELWRRVLVHRLYQQMHEMKYIVTYINLIMCLIVLPRNITTPKNYLTNVLSILNIRFLKSKYVHYANNKNHFNFGKGQFPKYC